MEYRPWWPHAQTASSDSSHCANMLRIHLPAPPAAPAHSPFRPEHWDAARAGRFSSTPRAEPERISLPSIREIVPDLPGCFPSSRQQPQQQQQPQHQQDCGGGPSRMSSSTTSPTVAFSSGPMTPPDYVHYPSPPASAGKRRRLSMDDSQERDRASQVPRLYNSGSPGRAHALIPPIQQQHQHPQHQHLAQPSSPHSVAAPESWTGSTTTSPLTPSSSMPLRPPSEMAGERSGMASLLPPLTFDRDVGQAHAQGLSYPSLPHRSVQVSAGHPPPPPPQPATAVSPAYQHAQQQQQQQPPPPHLAGYYAPPQPQHHQQAQHHPQSQQHQNQQHQHQHHQQHPHHNHHGHPAYPVQQHPAQQHPGQHYPAQHHNLAHHHHSQHGHSLSMGAINHHPHHHSHSHPHHHPFGGPIQPVHYGPPPQFVGHHAEFVRYGEAGGAGVPVHGGTELPYHKQRKRRGNLPKDTTDKLRTWFVGHLNHPYPTEEEKQDLMKQTGLQMTQISNWFINYRRRGGGRESTRARNAAAAATRSAGGLTVQTGVAASAAGPGYDVRRESVPLSDGESTYSDLESPLEMRPIKRGSI